MSHADASLFREAVEPVVDRAVEDLALDPEGPYAEALDAVARTLDPAHDVAAETFGGTPDDREELVDALDDRGELHRPGEAVEGLAAFAAALPERDTSDVAEAAALTVRLHELSRNAGDQSLGFRTEMARRGAEAVRHDPAELNADDADALPPGERATRYRALARWVLNPLADVDPLDRWSVSTHTLAAKPYRNPRSDLHGVPETTDAATDRDPATMRAFADERATSVEPRPVDEPPARFVDERAGALFRTRALVEEYVETARSVDRPDELPLAELDERERAVARDVAAVADEPDRARSDLRRLVAIAVVADRATDDDRVVDRPSVRSAAEFLRNAVDGETRRTDERRERFDALVVEKTGDGGLLGPLTGAVGDGDEEVVDALDSVAGTHALDDLPEDPVVDAVLPVFTGGGPTVATAVDGAAHVESVADLDTRLEGDEPEGETRDGNGRR